MASPVYISSSSDYDDNSVFEHYHSDAIGGRWPHNTPDELAGPGNAAYRPAKKQRVRGPDVTNLTDSSNALLANLGPNTSPNLQNLHRATLPVDATDSLIVQILEIFPDISHTFVRGLIARHQAAFARTTDGQPNGVQLALSRDAIYEEILGQKSYPKQDAEAAKRKRDDSETGEDGWQKNTLHQSEAYAYSRAAAELLAKEFPLIPMTHIRKVLGEKGRAYHAFLVLHSDDNLELTQKPYAKLKKSRISPTLKYPHAICDVLTLEIEAARSEIQNLQASTRKKREEEEAERANEEEYTRTGSLVECGCCYSDVPANRAIFCEGDELHFFCYACIRKSAETQIGLMKYNLQCFDVSGCQASFARSELREVLGSSMMAKLDSLQQNDEIRRAGLEGLEDCSFCSFKAVLPPVEEDKEFRCENPSCKVISCRLCKEKTHIPKSCAEARKDKGLSERHEVEEAMSKALIRNCPSCQVKIVKHDGCNKMVCPQCHILMCYVCQKDITKEAYRHFGRGCPQNDSDKMARELREIQEAARETIDKLLAENSELTEDHLRVDLPKNKPPDQIPVAARQPARGYVDNIGQHMQHVHIPGNNIHEHNLQFGGHPRHMMYPAPYAPPHILARDPRTIPDAEDLDRVIATDRLRRRAMLDRIQGNLPPPIQYPLPDPAAFPQTRPPNPAIPRLERGFATPVYTRLELPTLPAPRLTVQERDSQSVPRYPRERPDLRRMDRRLRVLDLDSSDDDFF
ncbi:hypothetical protein BJX64DRAFT_294397 [Aspergillus heterothallicus]